MSYYIATRNHEALWPRGVVLWWAADAHGYSTTIEFAGKYTEEQAKTICTTGSLNFMIPCEVAEAKAVRVVDIDLLYEIAPDYRTRMEARNGSR